MNRIARPDIPIVIASIGPKNVEMTAEIADGWQPIHFVPDRFDRVWGIRRVANAGWQVATTAMQQVVFLCIGTCAEAE